MLFFISDSPLGACTLEGAYKLNTIVVMRWECSGSLGDDVVGGSVDSGVRVLPLPLVVELVILGFRGKKTLGAQISGLCCYR